MSSYYVFKKLEQVVDCSNFKNLLDNMMVYIKMSVNNVEIDYEMVFDWIALINYGDYDEYEIHDDISYTGDWDTETVNEVRKQLNSLSYLFFDILEEFRKKTEINIYLKYDNEEHCSYFDFGEVSVLNFVLKHLINQDNEGIVKNENI